MIYTTIFLFTSQNRGRVDKLSFTSKLCGQVLLNSLIIEIRSKEDLRFLKISMNEVKSCESLSALLRKEL